MLVLVAVKNWLAISLVLVVMAGVTAGAAVAQAGWSGPIPFYGTQVAVNSAGDAVVAWNIYGGIDVVTGDARGFVEPVRFAVPGSDAGPPQVAIDDAGNALVLWDTQLRIECDWRCGSSETVWVARRPAGASSFAAPQQVTSGDYPWTSYPGAVLAMARSGRAAIAWRAPVGSSSMRTLDGDAFGLPRQLGPGVFRLATLAITGRGEVVAGDYDGRVVTCPPDASCDKPFYLDVPIPGERAPADVHVAANENGDLVAAYPAIPEVHVARRPAGAGWSDDVAIPTSYAQVDAAAIADDGSWSAIWSATDGTAKQVVEAHASGAGPVVTSVLGPPDRAVLLTDFAATRSGSAAYAWLTRDGPDSTTGRSVAQAAVRRPGETAPGTGVSLTPDGSSGADPRVGIDASDEALVVWSDIRGHVVGLKAGWVTAEGVRAPITLGTFARTRVPPDSRLRRGHFAQLDYQLPVVPTTRGVVPLSLSCVGPDGRGCRGVVTLRRGRTRVGRLRFQLAHDNGTFPTDPHPRVFIALRPAARRLLASRGALTLTATAVTTRPNGANPVSWARLVVRAQAMQR